MLWYTRSQIMGNRSHSCYHEVAAATPCEKMAATGLTPTELVIEFLVKEQVKAADIYNWFQEVYRDQYMLGSNMRKWVKQFKDGETELQGKPHVPRHVRMKPAWKAWCRVMGICGQDIASPLAIGHSATQDMLDNWFYKICAKWVQKMSAENKVVRCATSALLLQSHVTLGDNFLESIVI